MKTKAKVKLDPTKLLGFRLYPESVNGSKTGPKIGEKIGGKGRSKVGAKIGSKVGVAKPG